MEAANRYIKGIFCHPDKVICDHLKSSFELAKREVFATKNDPKKDWEFHFTHSFTEAQRMLIKQNVCTIPVGTPRYFNVLVFKFFYPPIESTCQVLMRKVYNIANHVLNQENIQGQYSILNVLKRPTPKENLLSFTLENFQIDKRDNIFFILLNSDIILSFNAQSKDKLILANRSSNLNLKNFYELDRKLNRLGTTLSKSLKQRRKPYEEIPVPEFLHNLNYLGIPIGMVYDKKNKVYSRPPLSILALLEQETVETLKYLMRYKATATLDEQYLISNLDRAILDCWLASQVTTNLYVEKNEVGTALRWLDSDNTYKSCGIGENESIEILLAARESLDVTKEIRSF